MKVWIPDLNLQVSSLLFDNILVFPHLALCDSLSFGMLSFWLFLYLSVD